MFLFWLNILWFPSTLYTSLPNVRKVASLASTTSRVTTLSHHHNMVSGKLKWQIQIQPVIAWYILTYWKKYHWQYKSISTMHQASDLWLHFSCKINFNPRSPYTQGVSSRTGGGRCWSLADQRLVIPGDFFRPHWWQWHPGQRNTIPVPVVTAHT